MQVKDLGNNYELVTSDIEINDILEDYNLSYDDYQSLFIKYGNAEILEIYGLASEVPYLDSYVDLIKEND